MSTLHSLGSAAAHALGFTPEQLAAIHPPSRLPAWSSALATGELAMDSVALASLALNLVRPHDGEQLPEVRVDPDRVAASFGSERLFRIDGVQPQVWAELSGFWRSADGWVRTHGNYPHHARRLREVLGLGEHAGKEQAAQTIGGQHGLELEQAAAEAGALVVAVRTEAEWSAHPQAAAVAAAPLVQREVAGEAAPRSWPQGGALPLAGIRVLDLSRVIAGPVAARDLALAGAEVLRVDSPRLPESEFQHLDTGQGKRSTLLDLDDRAQRERFEQLLAGADVLLTGYRPDALARFGLEPAALHERHPGLVIATLSAWGESGPWGDRRGFDSLVQAATGIAWCESWNGQTPGALPVQALDHAGGHLLAAAIAGALREQRSTGGTHRVGVVLARIAQELLGAGPRERTEAAPAELPTQTGSGITCAVPPLAFAGAPETYPEIGGRWGADAPTWS